MSASSFDTTARSTGPVLQPALQPAPIRRIDASTIQRADWTFFVYLAADNSLSKMAPEDLNEMDRVGSIPGKVNVFALVDTGEAPPRLLFIQRDPDRSAAITARELNVPPTSGLGRLLAGGGGQLNMGDPQVLRSALQFLESSVPSKHVAVDLWSHGTPWRGVAYDDRSDDKIAIADGELQNALKGLGVEVLSADACLMSSAEVAEAGAAIEASYLVASEARESSAGWNYEAIFSRLNVLFGQNAEVTAESFAKSISASYAGVTVTDLKRMGLVRSQLDGFASALIGAGGLSNPAILEAYRRPPDVLDLEPSRAPERRGVVDADPDAEAKRAARRSIDLGTFAADIAAAFPTGPVNDAAVRLQRALADALSGAAPGLSVYAPTGPADPLYSLPTAPWHDGQWAQFIKSGQRLTQGDPASAPATATAGP